MFALNLKKNIKYEKINFVRGSYGDSFLVGF